jgi:hypothetical protein
MRSRREAAAMKRNRKREAIRPKTKLGLPDLKQAKAAVVGSLAYAAMSRRNRIPVADTKQKIYSEMF